MSRKLGANPPVKLFVAAEHSLDKRRLNGSIYAFTSLSDAKNYDTEERTVMSCFWMYRRSDMAPWAAKDHRPVVNAPPRLVWAIFDELWTFLCYPTYAGAKRQCAANEFLVLYEFDVESYRLPASRVKGLEEQAYTGSPRCNINGIVSVVDVDETVRAAKLSCSKICRVLRKEQLSDLDAFASEMKLRGSKGAKAVLVHDGWLGRNAEP